MPSRRVTIVLFDDVQSLDVTGPQEVFHAANNWCEARGRGQAYHLSTASVGGATVRTSSGLRLVPDADLQEITEPGLLLVPGGPGASGARVELVSWLRECAPRASRLISVCTGVFLLAAAGALTGKRVTTHWAYCDLLAETYPNISVERDPIFVHDGCVSTSAGVTAGIDLVLTIVESHIGRQAASDIARYLVVFLRRPGNQAQFSVQLATQSARREPLSDVQRWIVEHPEADLSVDALAARAQLSPRQFSRAFTTEVGMPPGRYVDLARLEAARRMLEGVSCGVEVTSRACGYGTPEAMRRAFLRKVGIGPAAYQERFRSSTRENYADSDRTV